MTHPDQNKKALELFNDLISSHDVDGSWDDDIDKIRQALSAEEDKWLPISDYKKTPYHVMVYTKNGAMMFATMHAHIWYGSGTSGVSKVRLQDEWEPTHFIPLPAPPRNEGEKDV